MSNNIGILYAGNSSNSKKYCPFFFVGLLFHISKFNLNYSYVSLLFSLPFHFMMIELRHFAIKLPGSWLNMKENAKYIGSFSLIIEMII